MKSSLAPFFLVLLLCTLVYLPGLTGGFMFDDYANIVNNPYFPEKIESIDDLKRAAWSGTAGPLKRPVAMATFALNQVAFGNWPMGYKITNLLVHLSNGLLVLLAVYLVLRSVRNLKLNDRQIKSVATLCAALWLLHPINLTSVLYVVQRMTSLSATFTLLAVVFYCAGRLYLSRKKRIRGWLAIACLTPLSVTIGAYTKENALLVIPLLFLIEALIFEFHQFGSQGLDIMIKRLSYVLVCVGFIVTVYLAIFHSHYFTAGFEWRPFTLVERVLTESRVLFLYLGLILIPRLDRFSLFHDDFPLSVSLFEPITTILAVAALSILVIALIILRRRSPIFVLCVAWFLIGHAMESSVFPLELIHEHRNYFPSVGILLAVSLALHHMAQKHLNLAKFRVGLSVGLVFLIAGLTFMRATAWSDPVTLAATEAAHHPNSYRSVYAAARVYYGTYLMTGEQRHYDEAVAFLLRAAELQQYAKRPYFALFKLSYHNNLPIAPEWREELKHRLKNSFFAHTDWVDLHEIVKCHAKDDNCKIPHQDVIDFFEAALSNPKLAPPVKSQILLDLAVFYVNEISDHTVALVMLDEAVELTPNKYSLRMTRAEILGFSGSTTRLENELAILEAKTDWEDQHEYSPEKIAGLRERFLKQENSASSD